MILQIFTSTLLSLSNFDSSESISGSAIVVDGDTIKVNVQPIRLHGIDAPELDQQCKLNDHIYSCGKASKVYLIQLIQEKTVVCNIQGKDKYQRLIGICYQDKTTLNAAIVLSGHALAYRRYSKDYVHHEIKAKQQKLGMWSGQFIEPSQWRKGIRFNMAQSNQECPIKGNISRGEKIYHLPSGRYYHRTKIIPAKGERYFCSELEASIAGWRKSKL